MSLQKDIRDAIRPLVVAAAGIPDTSYFAAPRKDLADALMPLVAVYSTGDVPADPSDDHSRTHQRIYTLQVEIRCSGREEEDTTDELAIAIRRAILSDDTLGGLALRTTWVNQGWDGQDGDPPYSATGLQFSFHYFWSPE